MVVTVVSLFHHGLHSGQRLRRAAGRKDDRCPGGECHADPGRFAGGPGHGGQSGVRGENGGQGDLTPAPKTFPNGDGSAKLTEGDSPLLGSPERGAVSEAD